MQSGVLERIGKERNTYCQDAKKRCLSGVLETDDCDVHLGGPEEPEEVIP
jgi:hypothetical protein